MAERRYTRRKAVRLPARFRLLLTGAGLEQMALSGTFSGQVRDLSTQGLALETDNLDVAASRVLSHGAARLYLEWLLPGGERVLAAAGVAWADPLPGSAADGQLTLGLRLLDLATEHASAIRALVQG